MAQRTIDELVIKIHSDSQNASHGIDNMINSLNKLQSSISGSGNMVSKLTEMSRAVSSFASKANKLNKISAGTKGVDSVSRFLVNTGAGLSDIKRSTNDMDSSAKNLSKLTSQLSRLSKVIEEIHLDTTKVEQLASAIRLLGDSTSSLTSSSDKLSELRNQLKGVTTDINKLGEGNAKTGKTTAILTDKLASFFSKIFIARQLGNYIAYAIQQGNNYIETLNLFSVSFGEYGREVDKWANSISGKLGLDPSEMKRYAATYMDLARSLGVTNENAVKMSKNITQLTYDIASLKNITFETSFLKLRSGLAGKIFCLVRKGLRIATLLIQGRLSNVQVIC